MLILQRFIFYFYCMRVCTWCMWGAQEALCALGGQRTSLWSRVSPSTFTWVPGVELRSPALQDKCKDSTESTWGLHVWILLQLSPTPTLPPHTQVGFEQINKGQDGGRTGVWPTYVSWQAVGSHPRVPTLSWKACASKAESYALSPRRPWPAAQNMRSLWVVL